MVLVESKVVIKVAAVEVTAVGVLGPSVEEAAQGMEAGLVAGEAMLTEGALEGLTGTRLGSPCVVHTAHPSPTYSTSQTTHPNLRP